MGMFSFSSTSKYVISLGLLCTVWAMGFLFFHFWVTNVMHPRRLPDQQLDAIVVLTGDRGRIENGLTLLRHQLGRRLFISGVGVEKQHRLAMIPQMSELTLGYEAKNTVGNAKETQEWVRQQGVQNLYLVTSDYHMARGLFELQNRLPAVNITPYPVASPKNGRFYKIFQEYHKFMFAFFRSTTEKIFKRNV